MSRKIYFLIDYYKRGGIESAHQYCHFLNSVAKDIEAFMVYYPFEVQYDKPLYLEEYPLVKMTTVLERSSDNIVFVPEVVHLQHILPTFEPMRIVMMWLSLDYGLNAWEQNKKLHNIGHVFQSYYAMQHISRDLLPSQCQILWSDLTRKSFKQYLVAGEGHGLAERRKNIIAYNPAKDTITPVLCNKYGFQCVPLEKLTPVEIQTTLQECKIYIDFGYHPGRDRLPREAACMGCVVVTNRKGSAAFEQDIPIAQKVDETNEQEVVELIHDVFANYERVWALQQPYRDFISGEEESLLSAMHEFIECAM